MKILILDDDLGRHKAFNRKLIGNIVKNVSESYEAIEALKTEEWDIVFLDHDLGGKIYTPSGDNTGYEVAKWLSENIDRQPDRIVIHSFNPAGAQNMKAVLPKAEVIPGAWLLLP